MFLYGVWIHKQKKRNDHMSLFYTFVIRGGHIIHQVNIFDVDVVVDVDKLILTKNIKKNTQKTQC